MLPSLTLVASALALVALAVGLGVLSFTMGEIFILALAGMYAWQNFQMLQAWRRERSNARHS